MEVKTHLAQSFFIMVGIVLREELEEGVNVENVFDMDIFTWSSPINTLDELIEAVEN